jgi:Tol biopolymer transport system component
VVPVREVREEEDLGAILRRQSSSPTGGPAEKNLSQIPDRLTSDAENRSLGGSGLIAETEALKRRRLPTHFWIICFLVLLSAAGLGWWLARTGTRTAEVAPVVVPLTSHPGVEAHPSFSPDGSQVAFSWNGEKQDNFDIYVKLIRSGTQLRLTQAPEADSNPAWSPDGGSIAFIREGSSGASVFLTSPLGPPERPVALISPRANYKAGAWESGLAWSPDGRSLVCSDRNSDQEPLGLFLLSVESGEKLRLTSPEKMFFDNQPTFSPDGRTLAFVRNVKVGISDIYLLPLSKDFHAASEPRRLTFENRFVCRPAWTLDGQQIIFSSGQFLSPNLFRVATSGSGKPQSEKMGLR